MDYKIGTSKEDAKIAKQMQKIDKKKKKETFKAAKKAYKKNYSKWERMKFKLQGKTPKWKKMKKYYNNEQMDDVLRQTQNREVGGRHI